MIEIMWDHDRFPFLMTNTNLILSKTRSQVWRSNEFAIIESLVKYYTIYSSSVDQALKIKLEEQIYLLKEEIIGLNGIRSSLAKSKEFLLIQKEKILSYFN